ncbi:MAG: outer membrane lipoprotein chaperone LolA [Thiotrichaceae bacterium]
MKKILTTLINATLGTSLLLVLTSPAQAVTTDARQKLNTFFTSVNTMQGSFIQQLYSKQGKVKETTKGQLYLERPGRFRWIYSQPDPQQIISDGKNIWIYDQELDQVTVKPLNKTLTSTPAAILMQKSIPDSQFKVSEMDATTSGWSWFYLEPHRKNADFKAMQLGMDKHGNLKQMVLYDKIGQKTVITFNATSNKAINANQFKFTPPAGVDVIGKPQA